MYTKYKRQKKIIQLGVAYINNKIYLYVLILILTYTYTHMYFYLYSYHTCYLKSYNNTRDEQTNLVRHGLR